MTPTIVPLYAALLALAYVFLTLQVIGARRAERVPLGSGGRSRLERAMRAHGNFAEYVPFALVLLAFVELRGAPAWAVHALCLVLVAGRAVHARGIVRDPEDYRLRVVAMSLTFTVFILAAVAILVQAVLP